MTMWKWFTRRKREQEQDPNPIPTPTPLDLWAHDHGHHRRVYATDRLRRKAQVLRNYDLTLGEYDTMLLGQGGGCAICQNPKPGKGRTQFCVDHDHNTGQIRGLLCAACNLALGYLQDDPARCLKAAAYLREGSKILVSAS